MAAPDYKVRFQDAQTLLNYGFSVCDLYVDENQDVLQPLVVEGGVEEQVPIVYEGEFRYLDTAGNSLDQIEKKLELPDTATAPIQQGTQAGQAKYYLNGQEIGSIALLFGADVEKAVYKDYLKKIFTYFLL